MKTFLINILTLLSIFPAIEAKQYDHIFVSPHLDDVVFSCGGLISKLIHENSSVLVITFYSKQPPNSELTKKQMKFSDYEIRLVEDSLALSYLKVDFQYLDLEERLYIAPPLKRILDVFKSPDEGVKGYFRQENISEICKEIVRDNPSSKIYFPIGAGNHYDHTEIFYSVLQELNALNTGQIYFYEDAYVLFGNGIRKKHPVVGAILYSNRNAPNRSSLQYMIMGMVINSAIDISTIENDLKSMVQQYDWQYEKIKLTDKDIERKLVAMSEYRTQVNSFGGIARMKKAILKYYTFTALNEMIWTATIK